MKKVRNGNVDMLRGLAMLLVVLGHTLGGCTANSQQSVLYNIIWSVQMPLFMLISGYVTKYSVAVSTVRELFARIGRKTLAYILPWAVWSFGVRGIIFSEHEFLNIRKLLWNMDSGYWFLFSLWMISVAFSVSNFLSRKIVQNTDTVKSSLISGCFYLAMMIVYAAMAVIAGGSFLCMKLTLYYMPFYFAGYLFGCHQHRLETPNGKKALALVSAICFTVYAFIINYVNLFETSDGINGILLRVISSLCGCISVCSLCGFAKNSLPRINQCLAWVGAHSLEIYLIHYLFLTLIKFEPVPEFLSVQGLSLSFANFLLTMLLTVITVYVMNQNIYLRFAFFGKHHKNNEG